MSTLKSFSSRGLLQRFRIVETLRLVPDSEVLGSGWSRNQISLVEASTKLVFSPNCWGPGSVTEPDAPSTLRYGSFPSSIVRTMDPVLSQGTLFEWCHSVFWHRTITKTSSQLVPELCFPVPVLRYALSVSHMRQSQLYIVHSVAVTLGWVVRLVFFVSSSTVPLFMSLSSNCRGAPFSNFWLRGKPRFAKLDTSWRNVIKRSGKEHASETVALYHSSLYASVVPCDTWKCPRTIAYQTWSMVLLKEKHLPVWWSCQHSSIVERFFNVQ